MRVGVADYGLTVWDGGHFDAEYRWESLKGIGYEGIERIYALNEADAVSKAARLHRLGMDFGTVAGPTPESSIQWTSAFGKEYIWTSVNGGDCETFYRQVAIQTAACARWGIHAGLHNHMGTLVETQGQLEEFLAQCPDTGLILDTAHLAAAGGDPVAIVNAYAERLVAVHVKDWLLLNPEIGLERWYERGRFCALGQGNIGLDNGTVVAALRKVGYHGWVFVEQDTHLQDPLLDLAASRQYLRDAGL